MSEFKTLNAFEFHHVLAEQAGISIVMFTGKACSSCRAWKQLLLDYQLKHNITLYEIDAERDMALTNEFDVFHLPALFIYKDGLYHSELQCQARMHELEQAIENYLSADAMEMP